MKNLFMLTLITLSFYLLYQQRNIKDELKELQKDRELNVVPEILKLAKKFLCMYKAKDQDGIKKLIQESGLSLSDFLKKHYGMTLGLSSAELNALAVRLNGDIFGNGESVVNLEEPIKISLTKLLE